MTDEEKLVYVTKVFNAKYPETIFAHNVTLKELKRFGGIDGFYFAANDDPSIYGTSQSSLYHLGILMYMRGNKEKSKLFFNKITDNGLLGSLSEDF